MKYLLAFILLISFELSAQKYFTEKYEPFNSEIESPESFLGYPIGSEHTRHDNIVSYFKNIAEKSDRAILTFYGKTHEGRKLPMLIVSSPENLKNIEKSIIEVETKITVLKDLLNDSNSYQNELDKRKDN